MAVKLNPYLSFKDNAREAMEFYKTVFGGQLDISTFKDLNASQDDSDANLVMHSALEASDRITLMAADTPKHMEYKPGSSISISLTGDDSDEAELRGYFEKLSEGANVPQPLEKAPWGDVFGMLTDKFGINWLVNIAAKKD